MARTVARRPVAPVARPPRTKLTPPNLPISAGTLVGAREGGRLRRAGSLCRPPVFYNSPKGGPRPKGPRMTIFLYPFLVLAGAGFLLSLLVHLAAWLGVELPPETIFLHLGIFVVWLPTCLVANFLRRGPRRHFGWKDSLTGCPPWMRLTAYSLFGYAFLNFFLNVGLGGSAGVLRAFSGHWMLFYRMAFATLYSAIRLSQTARVTGLNSSRHEP